VCKRLRKTRASSRGAANNGIDIVSDAHYLVAANLTMEVVCPKAPTVHALPYPGLDTDQEHLLKALRQISIPAALHQQPTASTFFNPFCLTGQLHTLTQ